MQTPRQIPELDAFVDGVTRLLSTEQDEKNFLPQVGALMKRLVSTDAWLPDSHAQPHPQYYQQYLLYGDPEDRLSVVSFVWGPGQQTPIHDHTVWGAIGMLRGSELAQPYAISTDGKPVGVGGEVQLHPGDVELVSPSIGDIHRVRNAYPDRVSISIHAYGGNIGKIRRHVYLPEGGAKEFVSGYSEPVATTQSGRPGATAR